MPTDDLTLDRTSRADDVDGPVSAAAPTQDPYLAFALRWWWLLIVGGILGLVAGFGYLKYGPIPYTSVAQVQVPPQRTTNPNAGSGQAADATINYSAEATTSQMFTLVSQELAGTLNYSASELLVLQQNGDIVIKTVKGTNFISITVTDSDHERARLLAGTIATVFVRDVNERASAQIDARQQLLEGQIDVTGQRYLTSRLNQRQEELQRDLTTQRASLLQLQSSYQQELQRQAESDRLNGGPGQVSPEVNATRARWLETVNSQISDIEKGIRDIQTQIDLVHTQLAALPGSSDPSVSAAFASAYGEQLQLLTRDYAQLQLDAPAARAPLVRYGEASDPLPASGAKKTLLMGGALGGIIAAAAGFGIDLLRRRKKTALEETAPVEVTPVAVIEPPKAQESAVEPIAAVGEPQPIVPIAPELVTVEAAQPPTVEEPQPLTAEEQVAAPADEQKEAVAAKKPDDLVFLIERARQRRKMANGHIDEHGMNGTTDTTTLSTLGPRHRPLPTQEDDDQPLRRAAD